MATIEIILGGIYTVLGCKLMRATGLKAKDKTKASDSSHTSLIWLLNYLKGDNGKCTIDFRGKILMYSNVQSCSNMIEQYRTTFC